MDGGSLSLIATEAAGVVIVAAVTVVAWATGRSILRIDFDSALEDLTVSTAVGLGTIATVLLLLGVLGILRPLPVVVALGALTLLGRAAWRQVPTPSRDERRPLLLGASVLVPTALLALYPPTEFDAVAYHLPYAAAFVETGSVPPLWHLRFPIFPQLGELLTTMPLLVGSETGAQLLSLIAVALVALLLYVWGSRYGLRIGLWSAGLWLGIPLVLWHSVSAYIEPLLTLFTVVAVFGWERWRGGGGERWLVAAGLAAGFAAGTKYLGLPVLGALAAATLWHRRSRTLIHFALPAVLVGAPWYLRNELATGNPVSPFLSWLFGGGLADARSLEWEVATAGESGWWSYLRFQIGRVVDGLIALFGLPWRSVFDRRSVSYAPPLSPWLQLLPIAFVAALRRRSSRRLLTWCLLLAAVWALSARPLHILLPAFALASPLIALLVADVLRWLGHREKYLTALVTGLLVVWGPAYVVHKLIERGSPPATVAGRHAYRAERLPGYDAIRWLDRHDRDATFYGVATGYLHYAAGGRLRGDEFGRHSYGRVVSGRSATGLADTLTELGVGYLLVAEPRGLDRIPPDVSSSRRFVLVFSGDDEELYRIVESSRSSMSSDSPTSSSSSSSSASIPISSSSMVEGSSARMLAKSR